MWLAALNLDNLTFIIVKKSKTADSEDEKRDGCDSSVELKNGSIGDDVEEVADWSDEGEHASSDEETVHPVGHDGIKRGSGRVEPKCKSEAGDEETGDRDKKADIFFLESLLKSMEKIK